MFRSHNFSAGPGALPTEVLEEASKGLLEFTKGCGVQEISHRSSAFIEIRDSAIHLIKKLMKVPDNYKVFLCQGGATMQFNYIPINLLLENKKADYIDTGIWAAKAVKTAKKIGDIHVAASSANSNYEFIPKKFDIRNDTSYLHITSNNTVYGTQWHDYPKTGAIPLIADMSSDIMSREVNVADFGMIYAGAQKNLGPSGLVVVIIRDDLLDRVSEETPDLFQYKKYVEYDSMYNTPPTFAIYVLNLVLKWYEEKGGVEYFKSANDEKSNLIYSIIDNHEIYSNNVDENSRSKMNIIFTLPSEVLTSKFIKEAEERNLVNLKGYRLVGGIRVSLYNSCSIESCRVLADFMEEFAKQNG